MMAYSGDNGLLWVEPMRAASELLPLGERLRTPKQSAMNSRLPKRIVLPWEKRPHAKRSPLAETTSIDEGTLRKSWGKACYKSLFLAHQLSMFFAHANYGVVKIARSSSEVVLWTMKHIMIYPRLALLRGNSPMSSGLILKMNRCYKKVSREIEKFAWWKGEMDLAPPA
jgi:hypothetical protein